jgi:hypothetical protein
VGARCTATSAPCADLAGLAHHQRALVAITLLVWVFNVPLAVFYVVVGLVAGTLGGAFGELFFLDRLPVIGGYLDFAGFHIGGVAGALVGAVLECAVGTLTGLLAPLLLMGGLDPINMLVVGGGRNYRRGGHRLLLYCVRGGIRAEKAPSHRRA